MNIKHAGSMTCGKSTRQVVSLATFFITTFHQCPFLVMVCGRVMWSLKSRIYLRLKANTWNQLPAVGFFFFPSSDNSNDCNTEANPRSLLTKGCETLTVNYQMSIWASLEMESVDLVFNPHVHTKTKTNVIDNIRFRGHLHFGQRTKLCIFPKLEKKKKRKKKKKLDASALARKEPHRKVVVCETCFLGCRPRPGPWWASLLHVVQVVFWTLCSPPCLRQILLISDKDGREGDIC